MNNIAKPIPRNGKTLVAGLVARISGCQNQKGLSLEDQQDHAKQVVAELYDGPVEYHVISTTGKGERLDRPELGHIEDLLRTRTLDFLVVEDIGRLVRGAEAVRLCGIAVDHGTRVLAPNDCIDTSDDTWEEDVISACRDHVGHNAHTSKRLKHKLMNRFVKFGGATSCVIYGYQKTAGAKTYDGWQKDPSATLIYQEWFRRLRETLNCSAVAEWLNGQGVPMGKHCGRKTWDGKMVRRLTANPLLKGFPGRGFKHTVKHNETGRRVAVKNPRGAQYREYPHLAHIDPAEWDEVNTLLVAANHNLGRKPVNGADPRLGMPRKRTRFPGQHARCWYCGRQCVWGGNGVAGNLMCNGAREWRCWNSIGFDGALATCRLTEAIMAELYRLDGIDEQFRALVTQACQEGGGDLSQRRAHLEREEVKLNGQKVNMLAAIADCGPRPMLMQKLSEMEAAEIALLRERRELDKREKRTLELPASAAQLRQLLEEKFRTLAADSQECRYLLQLLVPEFYVYLVRLCDGGHLLPRARVKLNLAGTIPDARHVPGVEELLTRELTLDLFEPPQRERIRKEVVRMAKTGLDQRVIARQLPGRVTQTAVYRALALDRMMQDKGLRSPFVMVTEPPSDYSKLRRHRNAKYRFEAVPWYQQSLV